MAKSELIEKVARIYAKHDGFDPDEFHKEHKLNKFKDSVVWDVEQLELVETKTKKWELYVGRAKSSIEIFEILKETYK